MFKWIARRITEYRHIYDGRHMLCPTEMGFWNKDILRYIKMFVLVYGGTNLWNLN